MKEVGNHTPLGFDGSANVFVQCYNHSYFPVAKLVVYDQALLFTGSERWSARFSKGPFPVTIA